MRGKDQQILNSCDIKFFKFFNASHIKHVNSQLVIFKNCHLCLHVKLWKLLAFVINESHIKRVNSQLVIFKKLSSLLACIIVETPRFCQYLLLLVLKARFQTRSVSNSYCYQVNSMINYFNSQNRNSKNVVDESI